MSNFKKSSMLLATVLVASGILALIPPSVSMNAQAALYGEETDSQYGDQYGYESGYNDDRYSYGDNNSYRDQKDKKSASIQEIKCISRNVNINGVEITQIPESTSGTAEELQANEAQSGTNGDQWNNVFNVDRNLVNVCVNVNVNEQLRQQQDGDGNGNGNGPPPTNCDDCFNTTNNGGPLSPGLLMQLNNYLDNNDVTIGNFTGNVGDVEGLCDRIELQDQIGVPGTRDQIETILNAAFPGNSNPNEIEEILDCLEDLGLIILED